MAATHLIGQPKSGYQRSGQKGHYRRSFYAFADRCLRWRSKPTKDSRLLILETSSGHEIREAIRRGYKPEHIHVVNRSPQLLAHLRRSNPSLWNAHGKQVSSVISEFKQASLKLDVINLDLTSEIYSKQLEWISQASSLLETGGVIAVTYQRGREKSAFMQRALHVVEEQVAAGHYPLRVVDGQVKVQLLDFVSSTVVSSRVRSMSPNDLVRIRAICAAVGSELSDSGKYRCVRHIAAMAYGNYRQSKSTAPMAWLAMAVLPHAIAGGCPSQQYWIDELNAIEAAIRSDVLGRPLSVMEMSEMERSAAAINGTYNRPQFPMCVYGMLERHLSSGTASIRIG